MKHFSPSPPKLMMAMVMGVVALIVVMAVTQPVSARPPSAVTEAQSNSSIFVTVLPGVSPVTYLLNDKIWTVRSHYGEVGDTVFLPGAATNISLTRGAIITTSVPSADGGDPIRKDYTINRDITLEALTSKAIREIGSFITAGAVNFKPEVASKASSKVRSEVKHVAGKAGLEAEKARLVSPKYTAAPKCEDIYSTVKRFVKDHPEKVLEVVAFHVGQHETCACEIVKAAIIASDADVELVIEIVETAIEVAPGKFRIIGQCAIAVAPDALAGVQTIVSKYGAVSGDSGLVKREMRGMVYVPAGHYPGPDDMQIKTPGFWIDAHEVTIGEYADFIEAINKLSGDMKTAYQHVDQPADKTSHEPDDWGSLYTAAKEGGIWNQKKVDLNYPVVGVDWWDAYAYAQWRGRELPSHREWYAAYSSASDPGNLAERDWKPVNLTEKTSHGIHGMVGNVSEWVSDKAIDPADPSRPPHYMISGASYLRPKFGARAREWVKSRSLRRPDLGFRTYSDALQNLAKGVEKGDDKGGKGGAGGDLGAPFQEPGLRPMSMAAINSLANAVDRLSENSINSFNVLEDIVTDSNARFVGSTQVRLPNPVPVRRRPQFVGSQGAPDMADMDRAMSQHFANARDLDNNAGANAGDNLGGSGWDTEKGGEKGGDDFSDNGGSATSLMASVVGEVENPGSIRLPSSGRIDILTAIVVAGGYSNEADRNECILHRHNTPIREAQRLNLRDIRKGKKPMVYIHEGDMVTIKKLQF